MLQTDIQQINRHKTSWNHKHTRAPHLPSHSDLHGSAVGYQLLLELLPPQPPLRQVLQQVVVHHLELPGQHPTAVDVAGVGLDGLVVAEDLSGGGRWHGSQEEAVSDAMSVWGVEGRGGGVRGGGMRDGGVRGGGVRGGGVRGGGVRGGGGG